MKKFLAIFIFMFLLRFNVAYADSYLLHTIQPGDTYTSISEKYNKHIYDLKSMNKDLGNTLNSNDLIKITRIKDINIKINGKTLYTDESPYIENSRTFVPIRFISQALGVDEINWDDSNQTAVLIDKGREIRLPVGSSTATINGRSVKLDAPISVYKGRTFVPVRFIAENFDCKVSWDSNNYIVNIFASINDNKAVTRGSVSRTMSNSNYETDLYWLSRIVEAESKGESFEGKLAVANVVVNRTKSSDFPNTIKEVVFDNRYGVQYQPVSNGTIYNTPSEESINAANQALEGNNNIDDCLYFLNPKTAQSTWITTNRTFYKTIENHDFYK